MRSLKKRQRGFTLTEAAIVMGIIGMVLAGLWTAASSVNDANRIRNTSEMIVKIAQNVRMLYIERSAFTNAAGHDLTSMLVNSAAFPDDIISPTTNLPVTEWNTNIQVHVGASLSGSGPANTFEIRLLGTLPDNECKKLASMMVGPGREPALVEVTLGGATIDIEDDTIDDIARTSCTSATYRFALK